MVCDGQLITGQNPKSSEKLARCVLETLKPCASDLLNPTQALHAHAACYALPAQPCLAT